MAPQPGSVRVWKVRFKEDFRSARDAVVAQLEQKLKDVKKIPPGFTVLGEGPADIKQEISFLKNISPEELAQMEAGNMPERLRGLGIETAIVRQDVEVDLYQMAKSPEAEAAVRRHLKELERQHERVVVVKGTSYIPSDELGNIFTDYRRMGRGKQLALATMAVGGVITAYNWLAGDSAKAATASDTDVVISGNHVNTGKGLH
ncbi:MAG: hypothetical protein C5B49_00510 [Bdellovibrio sp.]|nr:MAG: hypothetical protein C5B49_00510 [Bdellovibrio sp.]